MADTMEEKMALNPVPVDGDKPIPDPISEGTLWGISVRHEDEGGRAVKDSLELYAAEVEFYAERIRAEVDFLLSAAKAFSELHFTDTTQQLPVIQLADLPEIPSIEIQNLEIPKIDIEEITSTFATELFASRINDTSACDKIEELDDPKKYIEKVRNEKPRHS